MKTLVISIPGATPGLILANDRLQNLRRLMELGCYGTLAPAVIPPDAGTWSQAADVWRHVTGAHKQVILVAASPLTGPCPPTMVWTSYDGWGEEATIASYPDGLRQELAQVVQEDTLATADSYGDGVASLASQVAARQRFSMALHLLQHHEWDYLEVEVSDLTSVEGIQGRPRRYRSAAKSYYDVIDRQLGRLLAALSNDTTILVVSAGRGRRGRGAFVLLAPNNPLHGEIDGVQALDIAPTLLQLSGYDVPASLRGASLVAGVPLVEAERSAYSYDEEEAVNERLRGLGYIE